MMRPRRKWRLQATAFFLDRLVDGLIAAIGFTR